VGTDDSRDGARSYGGISVQAPLSDAVSGIFGSASDANTERLERTAWGNWRNVHPATPPEEAASAHAKAEEMLAAYAEDLWRADAAAFAAPNSNWDKAAEHAARCAPYLHHKLVAVESSHNRKISEMTIEELEAAAQEAREELEQLREGERELLQDAVTKSVR
jgi:hypothetical protein